MGIIKRGILGGFSKKVGGVVGSSWKGIAVMKALPLSVANPKTASQTAQRTRFKAVGKFASIILVSIVKPLRDRFASQQSGYNTFVSKNIDTFVGSVLTTPADLSISEGNLEPVENMGITGSVTLNTITVTYDNNSTSGNASEDDHIYVCAYNANTGEVVGSGEGSRRNDSPMTILLADGITAGDVMHVWTAFRKNDGTIVSNTAYVTDVMP